MAEDRVVSWERRSEWPLAVLAAVFLVAYAVPILHQSLRPDWRHICQTVDFAIWLLFGIDYAARLVLARHRANYAWRNLPDLAVIALPVLRPLRLLRLLMLLRVLNRRAVSTLRGKVAVYVAGAATLLVFCSALAVLDAERHKPGANIATFGDALWWSITTVTTVGYGDRYPVSAEGRAVAIGLMLGGIALIGVVSASFATWLIDRVRESDAEMEALTRADFELVEAQLERVNEQLAELRAIVGAELGVLPVPPGTIGG